MRRRSFGGRSRPSRFRKRKKFSQRGNSIDLHKLVNKVPVVDEEAEYVPKNTFATFNLDKGLKRNVAAKGFKNPTPIQDKAIQPALEGRDVVGIANTGTGKTAAFLLPMLHKVLRNRKQRVLILAPTRELALQIEEEFRFFAKGLGIASVLCIGGASMGKQTRDLKRNHNFIIGTPGRIIDLLKRRFMKLDGFGNVVLDEADRMLDMGFVKDIRYLLSLLPAERQSLFFSATISGQVEELIRTFLSDPLKVSVKKRETAASVEQDVVRVGVHQNRVEVLQDLLKGDEFKKVLVFGRTKRGVDGLSKKLSKSGFKVDAIHGDKSQSRRQRALMDFKKYKVRILIATDVAARGLDIDDVSHVINFDMPSNYEDYVHRIGRTGRGNKKGVALTFIDERR